jgi:two-component system cell cycle response regulator
MDPLVRAALWVQRRLAQCSGTALAVALGAYLVYWAAEHPPLEWNAAAFGVLVVSTLVRLVKRLRRLAPEGENARLDFEILIHLFVLTYVGVLNTPGQLDGAWYPVVYALAMLGASFTGPKVAAPGVAFAVLLEAAIDYVAFRTTSSTRVVSHGALLGLFTFLNLIVLRAEIARIRSLSRAKIESELKKMREAARSYRLLGAPSSAGERSLLPAPDDEERLLRSGVDEIHQALEFALSLLRRTLGLRTAILLNLDASGSTLTIQELSSSEPGIETGPFSARDGIFGASIARGEQLSLSGPKADKHVPYYQKKPEIGAVCSTPLFEHGKLRGLLVVDRPGDEAFSVEEEETLRAATHFVLRAVENERVFVQLERAKVEQGKLYRVANSLAAASTEAQVIEAGVNGAREFAAFDFAVVTLFHRAEGEHEICAASGEGSEELVGQRFKHNSGLVSMVVANRHALPYRGDYDPSRQVVFTRRIAPPEMPSLLVLPLLVHEKPLGTLVLGSRRRSAFGDAVRPTLEVLASHVSVSLANARMLKRLEEMATTDGLTGLFNKRALTDIGQQKLRSASRFKKPLSLLVCDIDHFKRVNDTYGHDVGDVVIKGFADVLKRVKRDTDAVGRFGGEEFVVVCEETDERGAMLLSERIRTELQETTFHTELGPLQVICSIGVAPYPLVGQSWDTLFKATDEALYASKRGGRNRVTIWSPKSSSSSSAA